MNEMADASGVELKLIRSAAGSHIPINGSFELLPVCNMDCDMCYVRLSREEADRKGGIKRMSDWLSLAKEAKALGTLFLLLTGGEPLLYHDFKELYTRLQAMGFILTVNTNGTLIDDEWADFFAAHKPRRINLTLYGTDDETYRRLCHYDKGYTRAIRAVKLLRERNVDVKIGCSAVVSNLSDTGKIYEIAEELGAAVHIDSYMYPAKRERLYTSAAECRLSAKDAALVWYNGIRHAFKNDAYKSYRASMLSAVEKRRESSNDIPAEGSGMECMAGNCSFSVNWQGELRPCVMLDKPGIPVFDTGFDAAWDRIREELSEIRLNPKCSVCEYRPFCHICAASALYEGGDYGSVSDYLCELARTSYELLLENDGENDNE